MARLLFSAVTAEVALTAATAKTVIQVAAPANQLVVLKRIGIFFDGVAVSNEPVLIRILDQTTAGTMSALTSNPTQGRTETIQSVCLHTATAEPTLGFVIDALEVHPQSGFKEILPLGEEYVLGGGERIGIEVTAPDAVNAVCSIHCEE